LDFWRARPHRICTFFHSFANPHSENSPHLLLHLHENCRKVLNLKCIHSVSGKLSLPHIIIINGDIAAVAAFLKVLKTSHATRISD
jgi:hypothetical protein